MVCVRPGVLLVRASARRSASALMALDLPTLERPANATSGGPGGSRSPTRAAARRNAALAKSVMAEAGNSNKIAPFLNRGAGDEPRSRARCRDARGRHGLGSG